MEDRYIAAIDLGSSKIALSVAYIAGTDMRIVYYSEQPSAGIRNSGIFNETKAANVVKGLVRNAESELGVKIIQAVTSLPRNGIVTVNDSADIDTLPSESTVKAADILEMKNKIKDSYQSEDPKLTVYEAVAQSFSNGDEINLNEEDIIGTSGDEISGDFKLFLGSHKSYSCITSMMKQVGICSAKEYFIPEIIGKAVLSEDELENGVAVVDLGGGCSSVSIFIGGVLRFFSSIPFGGKEITSDIRTESNISERLAENIKLGYGVCLPEKLQSLTDKQLLIKSNGEEADKRISVKYLSEIITAREEEILEAIIFEIDRSGFSRQIPSGIVVTGGGANITNLEMLITRMSGYRVRIGFPQNAQGISDCNGVLETSASASVAMLFAAREDGVCSCAIADTSNADSSAADHSEAYPSAGILNSGMAADSESSANDFSKTEGSYEESVSNGMDGTDTPSDKAVSPSGKTEANATDIRGNSGQAGSGTLFENDPDYENAVKQGKGKKDSNAAKDKQKKHIKMPKAIGKFFDNVISFGSEIADEVGKDEL